MWQADPETFEFSLVSPEAEILLGYPVHRWTDDSSFWQAQIHPEDRNRVVDYCREASGVGEPYGFEYRLLAADGRVVWVRDSVRVVELGGKRQLVGVMMDITDRKRAEAEVMAARQEAESRAEEATALAKQLRNQTIELARQVEETQALAGALESSNLELRSTEAHYRRLVQTSPYGVFVLDRQGVFTEVNAASELFTGRSAQEILGQSFRSLIVAEDVEKASEGFQRMISGEADTLEMEVRLDHPS